ncbi:unnamed protein product [Dracunculus medinensis]|uniref:Uncharacterized protein n=1 Tax=Dracunculus medinensis TaxID=318479 RepID=A0A0N4UM98_DRAME|nr:unnamed protein product [Dracunculus medinensis]
MQLIFQIHCSCPQVEQQCPCTQPIEPAEPPVFPTPFFPPEETSPEPPPPTPPLMPPTEEVRCANCGIQLCIQLLNMQCYCISGHSPCANGNACCKR